MFALILMLQAAPIQDAPSPVESVTVSPEKQVTKPMPLWAEKIQPRDWPFIGGVEDRSILVFAKTHHPETAELWDSPTKPSPW